MELYLFNDRALSSEEVAKIKELAQNTADDYCFNVEMEDQHILDTSAYMLSITSATGMGQDIELDDMITFMQDLRKDLRRALKDMNDWYICLEIG